MNQAMTYVHVESDLIKWAERHSILKTLQGLGHLFCWNSVPWTRGTILRALAAEANLLRTWSDFIDYADPAVAMAEALAADPQPLSLFSPVASSMALKLAAGRGRDGYYLAAAFAIAYPLAPSESNGWRRPVCLWLLLHGVYRAAYHGSVRDQHLRRVANAVSNFQNMTSVDGAILEAVADGIDSQAQFLDLNRSIQANAERHLAKVRRAGLAGERLLRSILRVSRFDSSPEPTSHPVTHLFPIQQRSIADLQKFLDTSVLDLETASDVEQAIFGAATGFVQSVDEEAEGVSEQLVEEGTTTEEQESLAGAVLLLSAEQRQFLPWTWTTPNRVEVADLKDWADKHLFDQDPTMAILAALIYIGMVTGRGLSQVLRLRIGEGCEHEWTVSVTRGELRRLPPMRSGGWRPKSGAEKDWVRALVRSQVIQLSPAVVTAIRRAGGQRAPSSLGHAWKRVSSIKCEEVAGHVLRDRLPRIHHAMIGRVLLQEEFERSGDEAFARLLASAPNTGLPASCAYGSWMLADLRGAAADATHLIVLGSRLDPLEQHLVDTLAAAREVIDAWRKTDPVAFHNGLTAMLTVQMLAATGARPVRDAFESPEHINIDGKFVFINDKASGDLRQGRLVGLPDSLCEYLCNEYRRHLQMVSHMLAHAHPELAGEVSRLARGQGACLPMLFFLEKFEGGLRWRSVSEASIEGLGLFNWPLPLNLFRHRYAQRLGRLGLNREIIDGLLGHAENHAASYSDFSFRCWMEDMATARPVIQAAYDELGFRPIQSWQEPPATLPTGGTPTPLVPVFGIRERAALRRKVRVGAFKLAEDMIGKALGDRQLRDLSEDELYALSRSLLLDRNGKASIAGNLRYEYLLLKIRRLEITGRGRARVKRRFFLNKDEKSLFSPLAIRADEIILATKMRLEAGLAAPPFAVSRAEALMFRRFATVIALALRLRLANLDLLVDLLIGRNFRLVRAGGRSDIEFGSFDEGIDDPHTPCQRFPLSAEDVVGVAEIVRLKMDDDYADRTATAACQDMLDNVPAEKGKETPSLKALLRFLTEVIDQSNVMHRSGVEAGVLAGRVASFSPTWPDLIFLRTGQRRQFDSEATTAFSKSGAEAISTPPPSLGSATANPAETLDPGAVAAAMDSEQTVRWSRQDAAGKFAKDLRAIVNGRLPAPMCLDGESRKSLTREQRIARLPELIRLYRGQVGDAILLLAEWAVSLLTDRSRSRRISGVDRYLDALIPPFLRVAYNVDMTSMDAEELTDFYEKVMQAVDAKGKRYVAERLYQFHAWGEAGDYGIAPVDWAELPDFPARVGVAPGLIAESEYLETLDSIQAWPDLDEGQKLCAAFLLVGGYRFGLRKEESWGLLRSDWIVVQGHPVVLVTKNHLRPLKRFGSRRQVPMTFEPTSREKMLFDQIGAVATSQHGTRMNIGLLADEQGRMPDLDHVARAVNRSLKSVTGNRRHTLHHLRHSYATRLTGALLDRTPSWFKILGWSGDDRRAIRQCVLGDTRCIRRIGWAVARMLGHMGPKTTFRSYVHGLIDLFAGDPEWNGVLDDVIPGLIDLDARAPFSRLDDRPVDSEPSAKPLSFKGVMQFLRLLSRDWDWQRAARELQMVRGQASRIFFAVRSIGKDQKLGKTQRDDRTEPHELDFLKRITNGGWSRLLAYRPPSGHVAVDSDSLVRVVRLIGATRQIVMCRIDDVSLVRALLECARIGMKRFHVIATTGAPSSLLISATEQGMQPITLKAYLEQREHLWNEKRIARLERKSATPGNNTSKHKKMTATLNQSVRFNSMRIDKGWLDETQELAAVGRIGLVLKEDPVATPRNSYELIVILAAVAALYATESAAE